MPLLHGTGLKTTLARVSSFGWGVGKKKHNNNNKHDKRRRGGTYIEWWCKLHVLAPMRQESLPPYLLPPSRSLPPSFLFYRLCPLPELGWDSSCENPQNPIRKSFSGNEFEDSSLNLSIEIVSRKAPKRARKTATKAPSSPNPRTGPSYGLNGPFQVSQAALPTPLSSSFLRP